MANCEDGSFPSSSNASNLIPPVGPVDSFSGLIPLPAEEEEDAKESAALRIHSEAEKRRRDRINAHLSTLRCMISNSTKMDKASLLGRVIEQVKDLKRTASDISKVSTIPREVNEVNVECSTSYDYEHTSSSDDDNLYIKVSICCDDSPHLFADLTEAFHHLRLRTIKAELMSLGGRVHNVFILRLKKGTECVCLSSFKDSIRQVLDKIASKYMIPSGAFPSKRRRVLQSHYPSMSL